VHIVDRYFQAVEELGVKNDNKGLEFFISPKDVVIPVNINKDLNNGFVGFVLGVSISPKYFLLKKQQQ